MITIQKSHENKPTLIVGRYFINGCQVRPLDDLADVCKRYNVKQAHIKKIKKVLAESTELWGDNEDWQACISHNNPQVREAAALQSKGLDVLIDDCDVQVRVSVAEMSYGLEKLIDDPSFRVRMMVASKGFGLERLIDDVHWAVRRQVAKRGYGLDRLINDENEFVREDAQEYLNLYGDNAT